ncbi:MAG TPA: branched-chain amino acid ABC transporter substrate-binding protein, partial [Stellaceae bacterium]|nr:branched-chain amino acid ABC transporter substrate-binding protein [Stellaceae bacterium]
LAPWAYTYMTVLADAVEGTKGLDQDKLAEWLRTHTFKTVMGDIAFGPDGELSEPHTLMVQYQHLSGNGLDQFDTGNNPVILWPAKYKTGEALYPYDAARK